MSNKLTKRYASTISKKWIDEQIAYLNSKLGIYKPDAAQEFFFEPTGGFYGFIAQGRIDSLNEAMRMLSNHISSITSPIIEDWESSDESLSIIDHDFTSDDEIPGLIKYIGPYHSRIKLGYTNKYSPLILGAILAHELTHHYLSNKGVVYDDISENERLTDLATIYFGLGKLTLNGYDPVMWKIKRKDGEVTYTYKVGYLTSMDMVMILERVCSFRSISLEYAETNLTPKVAELVKTYFGIINRHNTGKLKDKLFQYIKIFKLLRRGHKNDQAVSIESQFKPDEKKKIIICSNCGQKLKIPIRNCNLRVKCPNCNEYFIVTS